MTTIQEICESIDYGFTASADFSIAEPRFLRITDIQDGKVEWSKVPGCRIEVDKEAANLLHDGDIVFARTGGTTGKSFLIKNPPRAVFASYLIRLSLNELAIPEFVYAFLQSNDYWYQVWQSARGGAQPNVNAKLLGGITFPLPPIEEQRRIVAILSERLAAVDQARQATQAQLEAAQALPAAYLREIFNSPEAQTNWPTLKLSEVSEINPRRSSSIERDDDTLTTFVPMPAVDARSGTISQAELRPFRDIKKGYTCFEENDVLFAKITPCMENGKHVVARDLTDGIGFGTTEFHVIRPLKNVESDWIHLFLRQPCILREAANSFTGSVGQQRVPTAFLVDLSIPVPSLDIQQQHVTYLKMKIQAARELCQSLQSQLDTINALPAALLRQAFSGEL